MKNGYVKAVKAISKRWTVIQLCSWEEEAFPLHVTPDCTVGQGTYCKAEFRQIPTKGTDDLFNFPASEPVLHAEVVEVPLSRFQGLTSTTSINHIEGVENEEIEETEDEEDGCWNDHHSYGTRECVCGEVFCWECCGSTNVHEGGKYQPDFMACPKCGADWYAEEENY